MPLSASNRERKQRRKKTARVRIGRNRLSNGGFGGSPKKTPKPHRYGDGRTGRD